jgi:hypothetical protein
MPMTCCAPPVCLSPGWRSSPAKIATALGVKSVLLGTVARPENDFRLDLELVGSPLRPNGTPIVINGLWDFSVGADSRNNGKSNQLFFTAGSNIVDFAGNGLFGMIFAAGPQGPSAVGNK